MRGKNTTVPHASVTSASSSPSSPCVRHSRAISSRRARAIQRAQSHVPSPSRTRARRFPPNQRVETSTHALRHHTHLHIRPPALHGGRAVRKCVICAVGGGFRRHGLAQVRAHDDARRDEGAVVEVRLRPGASFCARCGADECAEPRVAVCGGGEWNCTKVQSARREASRARRRGGHVDRVRDILG